MTVHQAKGLEFPVVALWDGKGQWDTRPERGAWVVDRHGHGWMMDLAGLTWEEPAALGIRRTERAYVDAERRRVIYVAATRARDLLVVPQAGAVQPGKFVCGDLLADAPARLVHTVEPFVEGGVEPGWSREIGPAERPVLGEAGDLEQRVADTWAAATREAARPRFRPASVSGEAHGGLAIETDDSVEPRPPKQREGRYGGVFGSVVHAAIGVMLPSGRIAAQDAVRRVAGWYGLAEHLEEAAADVARALETLRMAGLARAPGRDLQIEYPIAGAWDGGLLLSGYIDLVAVTDGRVDVIDFKTDAPPHGPVEHAYPQYVGQVRAYGRLLGASGILQDRSIRCGLLFTADGEIRWVTP
jgi:ATP-dependent helicase/nuclease subunit A